MTSRDALNLFNEQMVLLKKKLKSVIIESSQQANQSIYFKKHISQLEKKVNILEERAEGVDIESLEGKQQISVSDILEVLKTFKSDVQTRMVSVDEFEAHKSEIADFSERLEKQE